LLGPPAGRPLEAGQGLPGGPGLGQQLCPGCVQPCDPEPLASPGPACKDAFSSQPSRQTPFHLRSFHVPRREAAGRFSFNSDKLRSAHPFGFLQDGKFCRGGRAAAQLEHPPGYSCAGSSGTRLRRKFCKHLKEQPRAVPAAAREDAGPLRPWPQQDAPRRGLWRGRSHPAPSLQLMQGVRSSLCRGSPRRGARRRVAAEHSSAARLPARRAWPRRRLAWVAAVSAPRGPGGGVGAACSSQMGGRGTERVLARDSNPLASLRSLPAVTAPCLSPPRPGILRRPCRDGSRCGKSCSQPPRWSTAPSVTEELGNMLRHC